MKKINKKIYEPRRHTRRQTTGVVRSAESTEERWEAERAEKIDEVAQVKQT